MLSLNLRLMYFHIYRIMTYAAYTLVGYFGLQSIYTTLGVDEQNILLVQAVYVIFVATGQ